MEQARIERTLRLMRLMSGNVYLTVGQLAKRLDTSTRSIYRYIDTFKTCGFAVESLRAVVRAVREGISEELLAEDLRAAICDINSIFASTLHSRQLPNELNINC